MAIIATRDNFTRNRKDRKTRKISGIEDVPKTTAQNVMKNLISSRLNPKLASGSREMKEWREAMKKDSPRKKAVKFWEPFSDSVLHEIS